MFSNEKSPETVFVQFFDGETKIPFAASEMPIEQLPDTFELRTELDLEGEVWVVVAAEPAQKEQFRVSGKLKLYLTRADVRAIDPSELLYSLPTISDGLPKVEDAQSMESAIVFSEDDWRQFEFVDTRYASLIDEELASIYRIYEECRKGAGFSEVHVRERIQSPLSSDALTLAAITSHFKIGREGCDLAFDTAPAKVVGGFAFLTETGWVLWGQVHEDGRLLALNLHPTDEAVLEGFCENVDAFASAHGLYVVDWVRLFVSGPGQHLFAEYAN